MKVAEKEALFMEHGRLLPLSIGSDQAKAAGITGKPELLGSIMFERGVNLGSPFIPTAAGPAFIGAYSYMNSGGYLRDWTFIGRFCSIGRRVTIGAGMHVMTRVSTHPLLGRGQGRPYTNEQFFRLGIQPRDRKKFTVIGNDVWIGDGAVIVPGVRIGTGAVIGANTVVTRDVPAYGVVGGVPAKVIRHRFPTDVVDRLLLSNYWELPLEKLKGASTGNVLDFLDECATISASSETYETYRLS